MRELDIIHALCKKIERSPKQQNKLHQSDAEIVTFGAELMAITVDEFSHEDRLPTDDAKRLGQNLVTATISDLLAVGAEPTFFLHAFTATHRMDKSYLEAFASGVQQALSGCGAFLLGGDTSVHDNWRYTGIALGKLTPNKKPISRNIPLTEGAICITGTLGDANLAALTGQNVAFKSRLAESRLLRQTDAACIDTSDGFINALQTVSQLNPDALFEINLNQIPYCLGIDIDPQIPPESFLFASAGEYELLTFVNEEFARDHTDCFTKIGTFSTNQSTHQITYKTTTGQLVPHQPTTADPRGNTSIESYIKEIITHTQTLFYKES